MQKTRSELQIKAAVMLPFTLVVFLNARLLSRRERKALLHCLIPPALTTARVFAVIETLIYTLLFTCLVSCEHLLQGMPNVTNSLSFSYLGMS